MAQVMVNFRMDEDVKKNMEQACREMGMSMTTAFTIFATKVGKEKRIPFEITAEPHRLLPRRRQSAPAEILPGQAQPDHPCVSPQAEPPGQPLGDEGCGRSPGDAPVDHHDKERGVFVSCGRVRHQGGP